MTFTATAAAARARTSTSSRRGVRGRHVRSRARRTAANTWTWNTTGALRRGVRGPGQRADGGQRQRAEATATIPYTLTSGRATGATLSANPAGSTASRQQRDVHGGRRRRHGPVRVRVPGAGGGRHVRDRAAVHADQHWTWNTHGIPAGEVRGPGQRADGGRRRGRGDGDDPVHADVAGDRCDACRRPAGSTTTGNSVTYTATAGGGTGPYEYEFQARVGGRHVRCSRRRTAQTDHLDVEHDGVSAGGVRGPGQRADRGRRRGRGDGDDPVHAPVTPETTREASARRGRRGVEGMKPKRYGKSGWTGLALAAIASTLLLRVVPAQGAVMAPIVGRDRADLAGRPGGRLVGRPDRGEGRQRGDPAQPADRPSREPSDAAAAVRAGAARVPGQRRDRPGQGRPVQHPREGWVGDDLREPYRRRGRDRGGRADREGGGERHGDGHVRELHGRVLPAQRDSRRQRDRCDGAGERPVGPPHDPAGGGVRSRQRGELQRGRAVRDRLHATTPSRSRRGTRRASRACSTGPAP